MAAELLKLARDLITQGHPQGGKLLASFTQALQEGGLIPPFLSATTVSAVAEAVIRQPLPRFEPPITFALASQREIELLLRARIDPTSPLVNAQELLNLLNKFDDTTFSLQDNVRLAIGDIKKQGPESLYHLCLPRMIFNTLRRGGINSISDLARASKAGSLNLIPKIGKTGIVRQYLDYSLDYFLTAQTSSQTAL